MAITPADFRAAKGQFLSLDPLKTDGDGWITAIAVTLEGIVGCANEGRRKQRASYRLLASMQDLHAGLPTAWIASPSDRDIQHVNIFHPRAVCPFVGVRLPDICWGPSEASWREQPMSQRTLANFLEAARQVLADTNMDSRAR